MTAEERITALIKDDSTTGYVEMDADELIDKVVTIVRAAQQEARQQALEEAAGVASDEGDRCNSSVAKGMQEAADAACWYVADAIRALANGTHE